MPCSSSSQVSYFSISAGNCNMDLVNAINQYRAQRGLNKIPVDDTLCKVAYYHSWDQQVSSKTAISNLHQIFSIDSWRKD